MPIYEYACPDCGYRGEHMQKLADAPIAVCPQCGSSQYTKLVSAAGFALKGSGWYATDFKGGSKPAADSKPAEAPAAAPAPACGAGACPACVTD